MSTDITILEKRNEVRRSLEYWYCTNFLFFICMTVVASFCWLAFLLFEYSVASAGLQISAFLCAVVAALSAIIYAIFSPVVMVTALMQRRPWLGVCAGYPITFVAFCFLCKFLPPNVAVWLGIGMIAAIIFAALCGAAEFCNMHYGPAETRFRKAQVLGCASHRPPEIG
jgi:hypothetical protein